MRLNYTQTVYELSFMLVCREHNVELKFCFGQFMCDHSCCPWLSSCFLCLAPEVYFGRHCFLDCVHTSFLVLACSLFFSSKIVCFLLVFVLLTLTISQQPFFFLSFLSLEAVLRRGCVRSGFKVFYCSNEIINLWSERNAHWTSRKPANPVHFLRTLNVKGSACCKSIS